MPNSTRSQADRRRAEAAKSVQRAIKEDNPAKERATVGKPVIIDPANGRKPAIKEPKKGKPE